MISIFISEKFYSEFDFHGHSKMKLIKQSTLTSSTLFLLLASLSACTTMPTTVGFNEEDNEYVSDVVVESVVATKTDAEINEAEEDEKVEEVAEVRETFSSAKGYWQSAIKYLQVGNEDDARWALENALRLDSKSRIANELMFQLDVDAINELGSSNFEYKVQYGDSLSKLAKLYLDDSLKFYLLAKYNEIENPSRLVVGQEIQIPGNKQTADLTPASRNSPSVKVANNPSSQLLEDAQEMLAAGENLSTIELIENNVSNFDENLEIRNVLVKAYINEANAHLKNKDIAESKLLLTRAAELEPDNVDVNMMLIDMNDLGQADVMFKKSLKALASNDPINAYSYIKQALAIQPGFSQAIDKKQEIEKMLSSYYYKQALMAQRKHKLDEAIKNWDEVLILDENNDNAKLYRAKAIGLKIKLERFVSAQ